jgi:hypothetical protein
MSPCSRILRRSPPSQLLLRMPLLGTSHSNTICSCPWARSAPDRSPPLGSCSCAHTPTPPASAPCLLQRPFLRRARSLQAANACLHWPNAPTPLRSPPTPELDACAACQSPSTALAHAAALRRKCCLHTLLLLLQRRPRAPVPPAGPHARCLLQPFEPAPSEHLRRARTPPAEPLSACALRACARRRLEPQPLQLPLGSRASAQRRSLPRASTSPAPATAHTSRCPRLRQHRASPRAPASAPAHAPAPEPLQRRARPRAAPPARLPRCARVGLLTRAPHGCAALELAPLRAPPCCRSSRVRRQGPACASLVGGEEKQERGRER